MGVHDNPANNSLLPCKKKEFLPSRISARNMHNERGLNRTARIMIAKQFQNSIDHTSPMEITTASSKLLKPTPYPPPPPPPPPTDLFPGQQKHAPGHIGHPDTAGDMSRGRLDPDATKQVHHAVGGRVVAVRVQPEETQHLARHVKPGKVGVCYPKRMHNTANQGIGTSGVRQQEA